MTIRDDVQKHFERETVRHPAPPGLRSRALAQARERPVEHHSPQWIAGLAAAVIAFALVIGLLGPRILTLRPTSPAGSPPASATPLPESSADIFGSIPPLEFDEARLSTATALVTPFRLEAANRIGKVTLIGAYADSSRTVVMFRSDLRLSVPSVLIDDDHGSVGSAGFSGGGFPGDFFYSLGGGPRPGPDGLAHLTVTMSGLHAYDLASGSRSTPETWTYTLALKVLPSVAIAGVPSQFDLGSWKVTIEVAEVTPSVIHIRALIGASPEDVLAAQRNANVPTPSLIGPSGEALAGDGYFNYSDPKTTRLNIEAQRPTSATTYQLHFAGGGGERNFPIRVDAPDPNAMLPRKGLSPLQPADFPVAEESLHLQGFLTASIVSGRPNTCGEGAGASGNLFGFGTYFQVDGTWYSLTFDSDPSARQYSGPGTYMAQATLAGPTQTLYAGTVELTVRTDQHRVGPNSGTVNGTLDRTGSTTQQAHLSVSGGWTCTPGPILGPG